jgi:hypothetical protein
VSKLVLIRPGAVSDWVPLQAVLREAHEARQQEVKNEIEQRRKRGVPLDDNTDWAAVKQAAEKGDSALVAQLVSGNALELLEDYAPVEGYDQVLLRFVAISEARRRALSFRVAAAQDAVAAATRKATSEEILKACEERDAAYGALVLAAVAAVDVAGEKIEQIGSEHLEALGASQLLTNVYVAAREYQRLSPGKGQRFGSQQPSI